jgi:branched-chain amino acid transport system substrate-binding protein
MISRKALWAAAALIGTLTASVTAARADDLKVGAIYPMSGPIGGIGQLFSPGMKYIIDKYNANGGWHGIKLALTEYDDGGSTSGAANRFQQAIGDGVRLFTTGSTSPISAQLLSDVKNWNDRNPTDKAALLIMGAEAKDFTAKACYYYAFKMSTNPAIRVKVLAEALKSTGKLGTRVASFQPKYTLGFDMQTAVEQGAATYGYTLVGSLSNDYAKVRDFAPYIERLRAMDADTIFTANSLADLRLIVQAAAAAQLPGKFATLYLDEPGDIAAAGKAALGDYVAQLFNPQAKGEVSEKYRQSFIDATGVEPVNITNNALVSMTILTTALDATPKGPFDAAAFAKAMEGAKADWPMGNLSMRAQDHQLLLPLVVSVVSEAAKFKADGSTMGFLPVASFTGEQASVPPEADCVMTRP